MPKHLKYDEKTVNLMLNKKAYTFWPNMWVKVYTTSQELAESFKKEVKLEYYKWV